MFCRARGAVIEASSRFCGECGKAIGSRPTGAENAAASAASRAGGKHASSAANSASGALPFAPRANGKILAGIFALVLVCSLMPFLGLFVQQYEIYRVTWIQSAEGVGYQRPVGPGPFRRLNRPVNPWAIAALLCAVVGLVVSVPIGQKHPIVPAILGGAGAAVLLTYMARVEVLRARYPVPDHLRFEAGFWLPVVLFVAIAIFGVYAHFGIERLRSAGQQG